MSLHINNNYGVCIRNARVYGKILSIDSPLLYYYTSILILFLALTFLAFEFCDVHLLVVHPRRLQIDKCMGIGKASIAINLFFRYIYIHIYAGTYIYIIII